MQLRHHFLDLDDVTLHLVEAGHENGRPVIMLHGFPEFWYSWRHQFQPLAQAGYHVYAPDQRGYNLSDKPRDVKAYSLDRLAEDIVNLIKTTVHKRAVIIGHDWGAAVAWWVAVKFPDFVEKAVILNAPHPIVMRRHVRRSLEQQLRSWYIAFVQIPWLPEFLLRLNDWQAARQIMLTSSRPNTYSDEDLQQYVRAWSQPHAMRSMINWYRAAVRERTARLQDLRVRVPVRIIWGVQDVAFSQELASLSLEMCDNADLHFIPEATHWVQHDEAERVNYLILDFIQ